MKPLFLLLTIIFALSGCVTTYEAERVNPDTGTLTKMKVHSYREFNGGIKIRYNRSTGTFDLEAGEVSNGGDVEAVRDIILSIAPLVQPPR